MPTRFRHGIVIRTARARQLIEPHGHASIDQINLASDHVDIAPREQGVANQIADMDEFGSDLQSEPAIIVTLADEVFQRLSDEAYSQVHERTDLAFSGCLDVGPGTSRAGPT